MEKATVNHYLRDPVKIVIFDPIRDVQQHTFVYIGDVPRAIADACRTGNSSVLKSFYGSDYKAKLGMKPAIIEGGDKDSDEYGDIEELLNTTAVVKKEEISQILLNPGTTYITDVHVFPEDNFAELKDKIYLSTDIPPYRQHLFYISKGLLNTTYQVHAEGKYKTDIRIINYYTDNVFGIPIDKELYDMRDIIRVLALDTFSVLDTSLETNTVFCVDLNTITKTLKTQLTEITADTYQMDLIYYGFIIKFWPQLTKECFYDYIASESLLTHKYPDLAKNKSAIEYIYKMEREIIVTDYRNATRALAFANAGMALAITQMTVSVSTAKVHINIRNLFDKLRVSRCVPEIHAYIDYSGRRYMLRKRHAMNGHDIQFPAGMLMKSGITIAISLRKSDQVTFHAKTNTSTMDNEQSRYMFLNITASGRFYIRSVWNEEDEISFEEGVKMMKKFIDPLIAGINNLGRYIFSSGDSLPLITKQNIEYEGLNINVYWKRVMLENTFKLIKNQLDAYMKARICASRNVQQFDKYEFLYRKGIHEYDIGSIDRIISASNGIVISNQYAHLSNSTIKQKWDQNYDGRIVKMSHRTTDVCFEVSDIKDVEFQIFYRYIVGFVYRVINDSAIKASFGAVRNYADVKKLKKLREQDPELYNLKKYGSKKVYSIICQNQRQPLIYTQDEIKSMPAAEIKKLTQYWNFTLNKPAFYGCPNKKYPHLSFMVNAHPRHYCLPCCNKKQQTTDESKKTRVNSICLSKHKYSPIDEVSGELSRHVMNYGKDIDIGRLSKLPQSNVKQLLFNTLDNDKTLHYYVYGVAQHLPGCEYAGLVYTIAEALDTTIEELLAKTIKGLDKALFNTLLNGVLSDHFTSTEALIANIRDIFIHKREFGTKFSLWPELFTELFQILFNISIFTFIDTSGEGSQCTLYASSSLVNQIIYMSKLGKVLTAIDSTYIICIKSRNKYYPIFALNVDDYFKNNEIRHRTFSTSHTAVKLLFDMVMFSTRGDDVKIDRVIDLTFIETLIIAHPEYAIVTKYINKQNLCYGCLLEIEGRSVYLPCDYSVHISDGRKISFNAYDRVGVATKYSDVLELVDKINNFIIRKYTLEGSQLTTYQKIVFVSWLSLKGMIIGANAEALVFYFEDTPIETLVDSKNIPIVPLKYDLCVINKLITERKGATIDNRTTKLGEALYNNYLYQLFVLEFVNYLNAEYNIEVREACVKLIQNTNFKQDSGEYRFALKKIIPNASDFNTVINIITAIYTTQITKKEIIDEFESIKYEFDRMTLNRLKKLSRDELRTELKLIANEFSVQRDFDPSNIKFPNIYIPCGDSKDVNYCDGKKLIINRPLDDFVDLLAADLSDDLKSKYLLNSFSSDNVLDFLSFAQHPNEQISIYRLEKI
jgi:hypothetical protein